MTPLRPTRGWLWPLAADLACVLALALGGKSSHEAGESDWVLLAIAWPFAVAAGAAHAGLVSQDRETRRVWPGGASVVAVTYLLGMLLRALSGRGLAPGFLVVAGLFLAATMLGWRGVVWLAGLRRRRRPSRRPGSR